MAREQQQLLLGEMQHRIKNIFALAESLISLCAREVETLAQLAESVRHRLQALAHAHALTVPVLEEGMDATVRVPTLHSLISTLAAPCVGEQVDRLQITGEDVYLLPTAVTPLGLVLTEL